MTDPMTPTPEELKPCPFCGGKMVSRGDGTARHYGETWDHCPLLGLILPERGWNTRPTPPRPSAESQEVEVALQSFKDLLVVQSWHPDWIDKMDLINSAYRRLRESREVERAIRDFLAAVEEAPDECESPTCGKGSVCSPCQFIADWCKIFRTALATPAPRKETT